MAIKTKSSPRQPAEPSDQGHNASVDEKTKEKRKKSRSSYQCHIRCLDGSTMDIEVGRHALGEDLVSKVAARLLITEHECVGLKCISGSVNNYDSNNNADSNKDNNENKTNNDKNGSGGCDTNSMIQANAVNPISQGLLVGYNSLWLETHRELKQQLGDVTDVIFQLQVKFYDREPNCMKDHILRRMLYLQVRSDVAAGQLKCHKNMLIVLASFAAQAELGDITSDLDYSKLKFGSSLTPDLIKHIERLHAKHKGQTPVRAELNFLENAKSCPLYGVDVHSANEGAIEIGIGAVGILIYRLEDFECILRWSLIDSVSYSRKKFAVKLKQVLPTFDMGPALAQYLQRKPQRKFTYRFDCTLRCKHCYQSAVEHHTFFRLARPSSMQRKMDSLKRSRYRYYDRTLYQLRVGGTTCDELDGDARRPTPRVTWNINLEDHYLPPMCEPLNTADDYVPGVVDEDMIVPVNVSVEKSELTLWRLKSVKTVITPISGRATFVASGKVSLSVADDVALDDSDFKHEPGQWEMYEKRMPDGSLKMFRRRVADTIVTMLKSGSPHTIPVQMNDVDGELEDGLEYEIVKTVFQDGSIKKSVRRVTESAIPQTEAERCLTGTIGTIEIEDAETSDEKHSENYNVSEKESFVHCRAEELNISEQESTDFVVINKKPKVILGNSPSLVERVEIWEDLDHSPDLTDWERVEKILPDGVQQTVYRKVSTKLSKGLKSKLENTPIIIEELEVYEVWMDDDDIADKHGCEVIDISDNGKQKQVFKKSTVTVVNKNENTNHKTLGQTKESSSSLLKNSDAEWRRKIKRTTISSIGSRQLIVSPLQLDVATMGNSDNEETLVTTLQQKSDDLKLTGEVPTCLKEVGIDEAQNEGPYEMVDSTMTDGNVKTYLRQITSEQVKDVPIMKGNSPADVSVDEITDAIIVNRKPRAIVTDVPLLLHQVELIEDLKNVDEISDLKNWRIVERTKAQGQKTRMHCKVTTKLSKSSQSKESMLDKRPIVIEETEVWKVDGEEDADETLQGWETMEEIVHGCIVRSCTRSTVTVITPRISNSEEDAMEPETEESVVGIGSVGTAESKKNQIHISDMMELYAKHYNDASLSCDTDTLREDEPSDPESSASRTTKDRGTIVEEEMIEQNFIDDVEEEPQFVHATNAYDIPQNNDKDAITVDDIKVDEASEEEDLLEDDICREGLFMDVPESIEEDESDDPELFEIFNVDRCASRQGVHEENSANEMCHDEQSGIVEPEENMTDPDGYESTNVIRKIDLKELDNEASEDDLSRKQSDDSDSDSSAKDQSDDGESNEKSDVESDQEEMDEDRDKAKPLIKPDRSLQGYIQSLVSAALPEGLEGLGNKSSGSSGTRKNSSMWVELEVESASDDEQSENLFVVSVQRKARNSRDVPLRVMELEVEESSTVDMNLDDWTPVQSELPDGGTRKFHRKSLAGFGEIEKLLPNVQIKKVRSV